MWMSKKKAHPGTSNIKAFVFTVVRVTQGSHMPSIMRRPLRPLGQNGFLKLEQTLLKTGRAQGKGGDATQALFFCPSYFHQRLGIDLL